jgi:hypothetical protein
VITITTNKTDLFYVAWEFSVSLTASKFTLRFVGHTEYTRPTIRHKWRVHHEWSATKGSNDQRTRRGVGAPVVPLHVWAEAGTALVRMADDAEHVTPVSGSAT